MAVYYNEISNKLQQTALFSCSLEELPSKIKGLVRNVKKVEAEIVAVKISYLKRLNKGSNIIIMDSWVPLAHNFINSLTNFQFILYSGFTHH